jgi:hypothetical protein
VAEEQERWVEATEYLFQDLIISLEYNDQHGAGITLRSLARVWAAVRKSGFSQEPDFSAATIAGRLAEILNVAVGEATAILEEHRDSRS